MTKELSPGDLAPRLEGIAVGGPFGEGTLVRLSDFAGQTVVLYFYPKDDTPGCTKQACMLRDRYEFFEDGGAIIFGVSTDSPAAHLKFIQKHRLPFPLISDETKRIVQDYGVWVDKTMYGRKYKGTERTTFVIRPDGRIKSILRKVSPGTHADTLIDDLANFKP